MGTLTIINFVTNSAIILFLVYKYFIQYKFSLHIHKNSYYNKVMWITLMYGQKNYKEGIFTINLRNYRKWEVKESLEKLKDPRNTNVRYTLNAELSWMKTEKDIKTFRKNYSEVNPEFVEQIIIEHCNKHSLNYKLTK